MMYENDNLYIPEEYKKMSISELRREKERIYQDIKQKQSNTTKELKGGIPMNIYMTTYKKQNCINGEWIDDNKSNHTFFVIAKDDMEARERTEVALLKVNKHAGINERYVLNTEPRIIEAMSITHDITMGTSVTGIWE